MARLGKLPTASARLAAAGTVSGIALSAAEHHQGDALTAPGTEPITYTELGKAAREIAGGLADLGIELGDRVAILAGTRPEWTLADMGALCAGATVVPIYQTNSPEECQYILDHASVRAVICEDAGQVAKVEQARDHCPSLEHVIVIDGPVAGTVSLAELRERGAATGEQVAAERLAQVGTGRRCHDRLHLGDDGTAQGLCRHPLQPAGDGRDVRPRT